MCRSWGRGGEVASSGTGESGGIMGGPDDGVHEEIYGGDVERQAMYDVVLTVESKGERSERGGGRGRDGETNMNTWIILTPPSHDQYATTSKINKYTKYKKNSE